MTSGERLQLGDALEILRGVDQKIDSIDSRLRKVETHIAGQVAVESAASKRRTDARVTRGQVITIFGVIGTFALGLFNAMHH